MDDPKLQKVREMNGGAAGAVVIFFILLFAFTKWGPAINFSVLSQPKGEPMVVSGEGKATAIPDLARINAGIDERGTTLKTVQNSVNKRSQNLVGALKSLGIEEKDIKTNSYNIYPQTDYNSNPPIITGYSVSINYVITVRDIDKANDVLTTVTANGANLVGGITFDLSDEAKDKALSMARQDAVNEAKKNAESLAKSAGVTLGKIINISESSSTFPIRYALPMAGGGIAESKAVPPDVQPGTTDLNLTVSLSYEVR